MATTLSRMMKKAASSVIPLATKTTPHRNFTSAIFTTPLKNSTISNSTTYLSRQVFKRTSIPTHHHFSALAEKRSDSDDTLLGIIESEIDCAKEEFDLLEVAEAPREFPFKIVGNAGKQTITLIRVYLGEEIRVTVHMPKPSDDYSAEEEEDQDNQDADQDEEIKEGSAQYVDLLVSVSKKNGPTLEFVVTAEADGITIYSLAVKNPHACDEDMAYEGPEFENLDENLQEAFHTYLKVRGIEPSITKFLHDYMASKEIKEYTGWLKNLKNFIAY